MNRTLGPSALLLLCSSLLFVVGASLVGEDAAAHDRGKPPARKRVALIYNGPVSAEDCPEAAAAVAKRAGLAVRFVSDVGQLPRLLDHSAVFILGGTGDDLHPLLKAFTPNVTAALKNYLRQGGRYLGICGGGFMASTAWDEDGRHVEALSIIPAKSAVFRQDFSARILPIRWRNDIRPMFFKAGPCFHLAPSRETVEVFGYYGDGSVAALLSTYGKGRVAVCGPHPEARESWRDEARDGHRWRSSMDLAVALLKDLLSHRPLR